MQVGAIDIGGSKTLIAIVNNEGEILEVKKIETLKDFDDHINSCLLVLKEMIVKSNKDIIGVGVSFPGMFNRETQVLIDAPFLNWKNIKALDYIKKQFSNKIVVGENDVNACAYGEMYFNQTPKDFAWITISNGVGGAIVSNNKLIRGNSNCAGEIGHIKVETNSINKCSCGSYGCVESICSGASIKRNSGHSAYECSLRAREGSKECLEVFDNVGEKLGIAVAHLCNFVNPSKIYFGGGVSQSLDLFIEALEKSFSNNVLKQCSDVEFSKTKLGYEASLLGAASLVFLKNKKL